MCFCWFCDTLSSLKIGCHHQYHHACHSVLMTFGLIIFCLLYTENSLNFYLHSWDERVFMFVVFDHLNLSLATSRVSQVKNQTAQNSTENRQHRTQPLVCVYLYTYDMYTLPYICDQHLNPSIKTCSLMEIKPLLEYRLWIVYVFIYGAGMSATVMKFPNFEICWTPADGFYTSEQYILNILF